MVPKRFASVARQRDGVISGNSPTHRNTIKGNEMNQLAGSQQDIQVPLPSTAVAGKRNTV